MADASDLGSGIARCRGSSPLLRTKIHTLFPKYIFIHREDTHS